jgi:hypothetical protein
MPDIQFPDASPYNPNVKFGERPSAFDFVPNQYWSGIRAGSVTADLTGWIQDGLDSLGSVGGGFFYLPWGVYPVMAIDIPSGVELIGDGRRRTFLKRKATLPPGRGVLNIAGNGSAVRKLAIDGMVTAPVGYEYAELDDPMEYKLTVDSSIWIHSGATNITVAQSLVYHSGGYAILVDATTGDVRRVLIYDDDFENNRPNTAGFAGDTTAGGWGGGIHYQGNGHSAAVDGLHVVNSRFRRGAGNQLWGHLYDFGKLHTDIKATGCHFSDIGRDGILVGGVSGGVVSDCHFRRIGYVCTDDTSPIGTPKWRQNQWAVALDSAGLVRGVSFTNNTFLNCCGACIDADGLAESTVSGNTCRVSKPDEAEYAEDNVAGWPKNPEKPSASYCYGFQLSNSNKIPPDYVESIPWAARAVNVVGNYFYNLGLGAIRAYAARKCNFRANTIWHPDESLAVPILLGNIGNGNNQRAQDNSVSENDIYWNPAGQNPIVFEDRNTYAFQATDKNWIAGNRLFGTGMYEFRKDLDTASITGRVYSSNVGGLTIPSENYLQREDGYLRMYGGTDVLFTLLDRHAIADIGTGVTGGPLFNVSLNGAGGVISTGGRTAIPIDDCVATAVVASDSFLSMTQRFISGSFVYEDAKANLFDANFGLMRYNPTAKKFQISTAGGAGAGARIWTDLGGGGPAEPDQSVQWNNGGVFGGSADFVFNRTSKLLLVTEAIATGARSALPISDVVATGVLYADQFLGLTYTTPFLDAKADLFDATVGLMRYNAATRTFQISTAGGAAAGARIWTDLGAGSGPGGPDQSIQWNDNGIFGGDADLVFNRTSKMLLAAKSIATGARSDLPFTDVMATGVLYGDTFFALTNTTFPAGGDVKADTLPDTTGLIRYHSTGKVFQISTSGGSGTPRVWVNLNPNATVPGAPFQSVQFNDGGAFAGNANFSWNKTSNMLVVVGGIATGVRTALPVADIMATGIAYADNFYIFADGTFDGSKANLFDGNYGLLRFDKVLKKFQISSTVTGPPNQRVWVDLYTGGAVTPGGVTGSVQYKTATNTFGGDDFIKWDSVARVLTVTGDTNNAPSIYSSYGWIQSEHGFYSPMPNSDNVVNIPNGGVFARNLISYRDDQGPGLKLAQGTSTGAQAADFQWRIDTTGAMVLKDAKNAIDRLTLSQNGVFNFSGGDSNFVQVSGVSGFVLASTSVTAPLVRATNANDTAFTAPAGGIQVKSGAQVGQALYLKAYPDPLTGLNPPPTTEFGTAASFGGLAYKGGTVYRIWNGTAWVAIDFLAVGGGVTSITGSPNQVIANAATGAVTLTLPQQIATTSKVTFAGLTINTPSTSQVYISYFAPSVMLGDTASQGARVYEAAWGMASAASHYSLPRAGDTLIYTYAYFGQQAGDIYLAPWLQPALKAAVNAVTIYGNSMNAALTISQGYVSSEGGYYTASASDEAVKALSGGVWANKIISKKGLFCQSYAASADIAANPGAGYSGIVHQIGTSWWLWTGSAWISVDLAAGTGGTGTPGAPSASIQFNNAGAFGGSSALTFNTTNNALQVGGGSHADARIHVSGIFYSGGGNGDYLCIYLQADNQLALQTVIDSNPLSAYTSGGYGVIPGGHGGNILALQPLGGTVRIGPTNHGGFLNVTGNVYVVNQQNTLTMLVRVAAGATVNVAEWQNSAGTPLVAIDPGFAVIAPGFGAKQMAAGGGSDTVAGKYMGREIRFAHTASNDETDAGVLSYNQLVPGKLAIAGYALGVGNYTRQIQLYDDVTVNRNLKVNGAFELTQLNVISPYGDSQVYIGHVAPRIALGNSTVFGSRTQAVRLVMATSATDFGLTGAGDSWLFTEGFNGGGAGTLSLGAYPWQTIRLYSNGQMVVTGATAAAAAMTVNTGWIACDTGFVCTAPNYNSIRSSGGFLGNVYTVVGSGSQGNPAIGNAAIWCDGATLWGTVGGAPYVNMLAPPLPPNPTFQSVTVNNPNPNTQLHLGTVSPSLTIGDGTTYWASTMKVSLVLATVSGHYGLALGHAWLFLENPSGAINIGVHPEQLVRISRGNVLITGTAGTAALSISSGYVDSAEGYVSRNRMTFLTAAAPGAAPGGQAFLFFDGTSLYCKVPGGGNVNLSTPSGGGGLPTDPSFNSVVVATYVSSTRTGRNVAFQAGGGLFAAYGDGYVNGVNFNCGSSGSYQINGVVCINGSTKEATFTQVNSNRLRSYAEYQPNAIYTDGGLTAAMSVTTKVYITSPAAGVEFTGLEEEDIEIPGGMLVRGVARTRFKVRGGIVVGTE